MFEKLTNLNVYFFVVFYSMTSNSVLAQIPDLSGLKLSYKNPSKMEKAASDPNNILLAVLIAVVVVFGLLLLRKKPGAKQ